MEGSMRRLIMWNLVTLDGYFEGEKPWSLDFHEQVWGDELQQFSLRTLEAADLLVFGRRTYEGMAAYWATEKGEIADGMNAVGKVVVSTTLDHAGWNNTRIVRDAAEIGRLKQEPGKDMFVFGSAELSATLMRDGLFDEFRICVVPVVLGGGTALFKPEAGQAKLRLLEAMPLRTGGVILKYAPADD